MKKFYLFILAVSVAMCASAFSLKPQSGKSIHQAPKFEKQTAHAGVKFKKASANAVSRADGFQLSDYEGDWFWTSYDMYEDEFYTGRFNVSIEDASTNTLIIENFFMEGFVAYATVDPETGSIHIPYTIIGSEPDYGIDWAFAKFHYGLDDEGYLDFGDFYPTKDDLVISYDEEEECYADWECIVGIVAVADDEIIMDMDYWPVLLNMVILEIPEPEAPDVPENPADYESAGFAELQDGWLYPHYGLDPKEYTHVVALEKSVVEDGVYRLVDPFAATGEHLVGQYYNISEEPGHIKFNIADPRIPYVYPNIFSGYEDQYYGRYYFCDKNGFYIVEKGYTADYHFMITQINEATLSKYDETTGILDIPNALFSVTGYKHDYDSWYDKDNNKVEMHASIKILNPESSVSSIVVGDGSAPVEFFNLQGMSIFNPKHGGIYIMRQGSTVKKVIF